MTHREPWRVSTKNGLDSTVAFLVIGIPLLIRFGSKAAAAVGGGPGINVPVSSAGAGSVPNEQAGLQLGLHRSWSGASRWVAETVAGNLLFIIKVTVPLMLLAGLLGSALITLLPFRYLFEILPAGQSGPIVILLAMGSVALIGVFLPVPITFDVILTAVLWQGGLPVKYAMVLLFTLGIFSFYPFAIVWKAIGPRVATALFFGLAGLGVVAGVLGHEFSLWDYQRQQEVVFEVFDGSDNLQGPTVLGATRESVEEGADGQLVDALQQSALIAGPTDISNVDRISVERIPFQVPQSLAGVDVNPRELFTRLDGGPLGLDEPYSLSVMTFESFYSQFRGIASGDVHNDGWPDILVASDSGLSLYANRHGNDFLLQRVDISSLGSVDVVNAALVDLNDDTWLDIFFSTSRNGNYVVTDRAGRFKNENLQRLPNHPNAAMTGAAAFGDVDEDGFLDVVLGGWTALYDRPCCRPRGANAVLLINSREGFQARSLRAIPGASWMRTMTILLSDINDDDHLDLVIGNELSGADAYYFGNGEGDFQPILRSDRIIPISTSSTMSVASMDINNDLLPEVYSGQITGTDQRGLREVGPRICDEITGPLQREDCQEMMDFHQAMPLNKRTIDIDLGQCLSRDNAGRREDCVAYGLLMWARREASSEMCDLFPDRWADLRFLCHRGFEDAPVGAANRLSLADDEASDGRRDPDQGIPIQTTANVLLAPTGSGAFTDRALDMGVQIAGFTWNAKFADLDNDEFADLYAVNGWFPLQTRESHYFFRNDGGMTFVDETEDAGLRSFLPTGAYTYVDIDNDGDLDIVAVPVAAPLLVYSNNSEGNRIAFQLRDDGGNHYGVGSKVVIHYGPGLGRHQVREIQGSGGFISFDSPLAYFGLGEYQRVDRVEVRWSTGEISDISGDFSAGSRYIIHRKAESGLQANQLQQGD